MRGIKYYLMGYYFPITLAVAIVAFLLACITPDAKRLDLAIIIVLVGPALGTILIVLSDSYDKNKSDEGS